MGHKNWLAVIFDSIREVLDHASPSLFSLFATLLPYLSPLPIAIMTASSSTKILQFDKFEAGIFVFVLEGLGLWTTSLLVDSLVEFSRSRSFRGVFVVLLLGCVVAAYVYILVSLNVSLKMALGQMIPELSRIVTLICFLPLISGVMNGYWKVKLEYRSESRRKEDLEREMDERKRQERREDRKERQQQRLQAQQPPAPTFSYESQVRKSDWRNLSNLERQEVVRNLSVAQIMSKYNVSQATAYNWKNSKIN